MKLRELKEKIDSLIEQDNEDLPVLDKADEDMIYTDIEIHTITADKSPLEGLQLEQDFINAPNGNNNLIDFKS